jgi:hypothetical protein
MCSKKLQLQFCFLQLQLFEKLQLRENENHKTSTYLMFSKSGNNMKQQATQNTTTKAADAVFHCTDACYNLQAQCPCPGFLAPCTGRLPSQARENERMSFTHG